jgi:transposase
VEQPNAELFIQATDRLPQPRRTAADRVATRYDKLIESFAAFVLLACIRIWIKFVHAA